MLCLKRWNFSLKSCMQGHGRSGNHAVSGYVGGGGTYLFKVPFSSDTHSTSSKRQYQLYYFDAKGLGEPIRWILHYSHVPFEDVRIPWNYPAWIQSTKVTFRKTMGQIPALILPDGKVLGQSVSISRYLAAEFGLEPQSNWEQAKTQELVCNLLDLFLLWRSRLFFLEQATRESTQQMINLRFPFYYKTFNKLLKESSGDFVMGQKLTYADFWLASFIEMWDGPAKGPAPVMPFELPPPDISDLFENYSKQFKYLHTHKNLVLDIPEIRDWVQQRPQTRF